RLQAAPGGRRVNTSLVELDTELREVMDTPIGFYTVTWDDHSHGLIAFQPLADRSIVFTTDQGYLHRVVPQEGGPAAVQVLGWFHQQGRAFVASLFTSDGRRHLMGLSTQRGDAARQQLEWLVYDLKARTSVAVPVSLPEVNGQVRQETLLYGSVARD